MPDSLNEPLGETEITHIRRHVAAGTTLDELGARALFEIVPGAVSRVFLVWWLVMVSVLGGYARSMIFPSLAGGSLRSARSSAA